MRACVLFSGGKDSNLALLEAVKRHSIACLVTLKPESVESRLFHYPNVHLVKMQAEALGLPLIEEQSPDDEAGSLEALRRALDLAKRAFNVDTVVTGAVKSRYQAEKFARVCSELNLDCFNPLWGWDELELLKEVVERGIRAIFTRVAGYPLKRSLLGRTIDGEVIRLLSGLRSFINPSGEGGEYETLVLDSPLFRKRIAPLKWRVEGSDYDAVLVVEEAELLDKE